MSPDELLSALREAIDETERIALAASAGPWRVEPVVYGPPGDGWGDPSVWEIGSPSATVAAHQIYEGGGIYHQGDANHIARHDPASVLRRVAADRLLVGHYERVLQAQSRWESAERELSADIDHQERTGRWDGAGFPDVRLRALRREDDYLTAMEPVLRELARALARGYGIDTEEEA